MNELEELRKRYRQASSDKERAAIVLQAEKLKDQTIYQCYYQSDVDDPETRCTERQAACWCSDAHRIKWQESNYIDVRIRGEHKLSIKEIQSRLHGMGGRKQQELL